MTQSVKKRPAIAVLAFAVLSLSARAQEPSARDEVAVSPLIERPLTVLDFDAIGRLRIGVAGDEDSMRLVFDKPSESFQNSGIAGFLGLIVTGATDFVSTVHTSSLFRRLERWPDEPTAENGERLEQLLEEFIEAGVQSDAPIRRRNLGLLAARRASELGLPNTAVRLADFDLPGRVDPGPLAESIATIPANLPFLIVIDQERLPPSHIGRLGELLGRTGIAQAIEARGQSLLELPSEALIRGQGLASASALAPLAWAGLVGNFRIQRTIVGITADRGGESEWIRHEGWFDHERWASAFEQLGVATERDGNRVSATFDPAIDMKLSVTPSVLTIDFRAAGGRFEHSEETVGAERAVALAESIDPSDGLTGLVIAPLPEVSADIARRIPRRFTVRAQLNDDGSPSHRLRLDWWGRSADAAESLFQSCREVQDLSPELGMEFSLDDERVRLDVDVTGWLDPELVLALSRFLPN